jgi:hypothetical protein
LPWLLAVTEQCTYDLKLLSDCFGICSPIRTVPSAKLHTVSGQKEPLLDRPGRGEAVRHVEWRHLLRFLFQPPRVAALCELVDDMIGYRVSLLFGQSCLRSADDLARAWGTLTTRIGWVGNLAPLAFVLSTMSTQPSRGRPVSAIISCVQLQARSPAARQRLVRLPTPDRPALRLIERKRRSARNKGQPSSGCETVQ